MLQDQWVIVDLGGVLDILHWSPVFEVVVHEAKFLQALNFIVKVPGSNVVFLKEHAMKHCEVPSVQS